MLFERQRVLLTLLDALGGQSAPADFQKLLFLYTREEAEPSYEFVPYRFGRFSFSSYADKRRLIEQGLLVDDAQQWLMKTCPTLSRKHGETVCTAGIREQLELL